MPYLTSDNVVKFATVIGAAVIDDQFRRRIFQDPKTVRTVFGITLNATARRRLKRVTRGADATRIRALMEIMEKMICEEDCWDFPTAS